MVPTRCYLVTLVHKTNYAISRVAIRFNRDEIQEDAFVYFREDEALIIGLLPPGYESEWAVVDTIKIEDILDA